MAQMNMIQALNSAMDVMLGRDASVVVLGEDVGFFGGVFRVTDGLVTEIRVFQQDTHVLLATLIGRPAVAALLRYAGAGTSRTSAVAMPPPAHIAATAVPPPRRRPRRSPPAAARVPEPSFEAASRHLRMRAAGGTGAPSCRIIQPVRSRRGCGRAAGRPA